MSATQTVMAYGGHTPTEMEERVLEHLKSGREEGRPWGYTTASFAASAIGTDRYKTTKALKSLKKVDWVERIGPEGVGMYRFVEDPRDD